MKITKRRLAEIGCILALIGVGIRQTRVLWDVPLFDAFDLSRYGIPFSERTYSFQNGFGSAMFLALWVALMLKGRKSPDIPSSRSDTEPPVSDPRCSKSSGREQMSQPFEIAVPSWTIVQPSHKKERK